jgi:hypothetical protein
MLGAVERARIFGESEAVVVVDRSATGTAEMARYNTSWFANTTFLYSLVGFVHAGVLKLWDSRLG